MEKLDTMLSSSMRHTCQELAIQIASAPSYPITLHIHFGANACQVNSQSLDTPHSHSYAERQHTSLTAADASVQHNTHLHPSQLMQSHHNHNSKHGPHSLPPSAPPELSDFRLSTAISPDIQPQHFQHLCNSSHLGQLEAGVDFRGVLLSWWNDLPEAGSSADQLASRAVALTDPVRSTWAVMRPFRRVSPAGVHTR